MLINMANSQTGAQAAIAQLVAEGVEVIFGIAGGHNLCLCDAVLDYPELTYDQQQLEVPDNDN